MLARNYQTRFYCQIDDDTKSCNIEIWSKKFYDIGRDCIIPVHNIHYLDKSRQTPYFINYSKTYIIIWAKISTRDSLWYK